MSDARELLERLVYHSVDGRRYTQQSPVMPDVWIEFGLKPGVAVDLLLVPDSAFTTTELVQALRERLQADPGRREFRFAGPDAQSTADVAPAFAANKSAVAARLHLDQLVRVALPLSRWWRQKFVAPVPDATDAAASPSDGVELPFGRAERRDDYVDALKRALDDPRGAGGAREQGLLIHRDVEWLTRVAGAVARLSTEQGWIGRPDDFGQDADLRRLRGVLGDTGVLAASFVDLLEDLPEVERFDPPRLFSVNLNRRSEGSLADSVPTVKADAARSVFGVSGAGIAWAVVDSGIDATHTAFRRRDGAGVPAAVPFEEKAARSRRRAGSTKLVNHTRVVRTLDFVHVRELLGCEPEDVDQLSERRFPVLGEDGMRDRLKALLEDFQQSSVSWSRLEPFLEVRHAPGGAYRPPVNAHGTHVAGIIGADWRPDDGDAGDPGEAEVSLESAPDGEVSGVCPEIELFDLRVLGDDGAGNEFAIMSALQYVRDVNARRGDIRAIHGVNLSFSIQHDVANYACGRTPVCDEAERLVASGVVVVAAAGNSGRARYLTPEGSDDGFRTVSITDPGNAHRVITVGATHRSDPHTYGVSYFSSRGPTGDGRSKPDLVAPGEKITSTVPGHGAASLDGTSMAAPHVSGAAALVLARHMEFMGQPERIKQILCDTATDLGREPYFQGAGLVDVLRALQSI